MSTQMMMRRMIMMLKRASVTADLARPPALMQSPVLERRF
jgi:hypothetical protein